MGVACRNNSKEHSAKSIAKSVSSKQLAAGRQAKETNRNTGGQ